MKPTNLLNEDGTASMATMIMLSHHAFRRDLGRFAAAIAAERDMTALREEWGLFCQALQGHHQAEDNGIFPSTRTEHPELCATVDLLASQHHMIEPLLERGKEAFGELNRAAARTAVGDLYALLDDHLDLEEATIIPLLRGANQFPTPATDDEAQLYADGFAWAMHGIAPDVVTKVKGMLPAVLIDRLAAAQTKFAERCEHAWGDYPTTASTTSIPTSS